MPHTRQKILDLLAGKFLVTLSTRSQESVRCRCMFFANDPDFNFYMLTGKDSVKTREILGDPRVTLLVIDESPNMLKSTEVEIIGTAKVLEDPEERRLGLDLLVPKNPAASITRQIGAVELFDIIQVRPQTIIFRIYSEASSGVGATVFDFTKDSNGVVIDSSI